MDWIRHGKGREMLWLFNSFLQFVLSISNLVNSGGKTGTGIRGEGKRGLVGRIERSIWIC